VNLHRKRSHVVALDPAGQVIVSRRIGNAPAEFLRIFGELEPHPVEVVFEATYGWSWFADLLADAGIPAHMAHPLATKAIAAARVKNDAVDATTLAHLLRTNLLAEAWIAPPAAREGPGGCRPAPGRRHHRRGRPRRRRPARKLRRRCPDTAAAADPGDRAGDGRHRDRRGQPAEAHELRGAGEPAPVADLAGQGERPRRVTPR
jgi:hypothetical protein